MNKIISFDQKKIMCPSHIRWNEFRNRLKGIEGCNFRIHENGKPIWNCGNNHLYSRAILKSMPEIDVEKSIEYFEEQGGYCDCEVLFNVDTDKTLLNMISSFK